MLKYNVNTHGTIEIFYSNIITFALSRIEGILLGLSSVFCYLEGNLRCNNRYATNSIIGKLGQLQHNEKVRI